MDDSYGYSHKVFVDGMNMAIQWQEVAALSGYPTVRLEIAQMRGREANWSDKWSVDIAKKEMHPVASVLLGFSSECTFRFHGDSRNVAYTLQRQHGGLMIEIQNAGPKRGIVVPMPETFWLATMVINVIMKNASPGLPPSVVVPLIQRTQG